MQVHNKLWLCQMTNQGGRSTNGTSKGFTLDTTGGNLKKENRSTVDSLLDPTLTFVDIDKFILNLKIDKS